MLDNNKVIISINGSKSEQDMTNLTLNIPSEAAALLSLMQSQMPVAKVSDTFLDLNNVIQENTTSALVRQQPKELAEINKKRQLAELIKTETNSIKKYAIDEELGIALGVIVGITKKTQIAEIMKLFSKFAPDNNESLYFYNDLSLSIFFDNNDIVSEMKFGNLYKGKTNLNLSIGDSVEKAIELYGQPKLKSLKGAIWNKFAIFCDKNIITSIRIQR